jgi:hypothetical protein
LSKQYFVEVFQALIKRHDTLRTSFHMVGEEPVQRIHKLWQNQRFASGEIKNQETYWLSRMSGEPPVLELPTDYSRPPAQNFAGDSVFL